MVIRSKIPVLPKKRRRMNGRGNLPFCGQCGALHSRLPSKHAMLTGAAPVVCSKCRGLLGTNVHGAQPCEAMQAAYKMCTQGLIATNRGWIEEAPDPEDYDTLHSCVSPSKYASAMLLLFDMPAKLAQSRYCSYGNKFECWTTHEGMELLLFLQDVARRFGVVSTPDLARRFAADMNAFTEFRALWNLGTPEKVLERVIAPILKGAPLRARP